MLERQLIYIPSPMLSIQHYSNVVPMLEGRLIYIIDIPSPMLSIQHCFNVVPMVKVQPTCFQLNIYIGVWFCVSWVTLLAVDQYESELL